MQTQLIDISAHKPIKSNPEIELSFVPFLNYLRERSSSADCHKGHFFNYVIQQFELHPELLQPINVHEVYKYTTQLQLIYSTLSPIVDDESMHHWALCLPLKPIFFYSTDTFFNTLADVETGKVREAVLLKKDGEKLRKRMLFTYSFILEKCYNITSFVDNEMVEALLDEETGLTKFYKMQMDTRFINVHPLQTLPAISVTELHSKKDLLGFLEEVLPFEMFKFEGFGITNVTDVTTQQSIEEIKNILLDHAPIEEQRYFSRFIQSLKTLVGNNKIEFGVLPFLQVNKKLIFNDETCLNSIMIKAAREQGVEEMLYLSLAEEFLKAPKLIFFNEETTESELPQIIGKALRQSGIVAYSLMPIFFNKSVVGVMEMYTRTEGVFNESMLSKLDQAIPLLSQLLKNTIDEFNIDIDKVIKEKFTSVQPSVEWKFNEVAWHHIRDTMNDTIPAEMEEIVFDKVFPLYGAVDIRNSTVERNAALNKDLQVQFKVLIKVLEQLKSKSRFGLIDEKIFSSQKWLKKIMNPLGFNQEIKLNDFLENDITPFLIQFTSSQPEYNEIISEYFAAIDNNKGVAFHNRRQLEKSMTTVISSVNTYFDLLKDEIQEAYPVFFEKFRTDGVEYDIYIGQSIAPDKPYSEMYLKNLRLMQLTSMAAVARYAHSLLPQLSRFIETTQLIFIHSTPIDIRFRIDEKRFDVEGAYNIRYHIIKKRIDKVRIKDSTERLTQPNKIALVYFSKKEADEFIAYINYLQDSKILKDDLEYLELEELQGVSGLKALRVGVELEGNSDNLSTESFAGKAMAVLMN